MASTEITALVAAIGTSIVGPMIAYAKATNEARIEGDKLKAKRAEAAAKRDTDHQLLKQEVDNLKNRLCEIEDLREIMHEVKNSVAKIEAVLPLLTRIFEEKKVNQ